jgi:hypothetical protein
VADAAAAAAVVPEAELVLGGEAAAITQMSAMHAIACCL